MKTTLRLISTVLLALYFAITARAVTLRPPSLFNINIVLHILGGNGVELANSGNATATFTPGGSFAFLDVSGTVALGQYGTYSYTPNGETTATLFYNVVGHNKETMNLVFTDGLSGTYTATEGYGTANGTFSLGANDTSAALVNISSRLDIAAGQSAIAGFVVGQPIPRRVLIRAVGPGMIPFGVTNYIRGTKMSLHQGDQVIGTNTGWSSNATKAAELRDAFAAVGAFALATGSLDSAMVLTLPPGIYTCVVDGILPSDMGNVMIEVYYVP